MKRTIERIISEAAEGDSTSLRGLIDTLINDFALEPEELIYLANKHFDIPAHVVRSTWQDLYYN